MCSIYIIYIRIYIIYIYIRSCRLWFSIVSDSHPSKTFDHVHSDVGLGVSSKRNYYHKLQTALDLALSLNQVWDEDGNGSRWACRIL